MLSFVFCGEKEGVSIGGDESKLPLSVGRSGRAAGARACSATLPQTSPPTRLATNGKGEQQPRPTQLELFSNLRLVNLYCPGHSVTHSASQL